MTDLALDAITADPRQPRTVFDKTKLQELADSIAELGVAEPIIVRPAPEPDRYIIIAGERRWRAAAMAGLTAIPAVVREDLTDTQVFSLQLVENAVRADMTPLEEARAFQRLIDEGKTPTEVAALIGKGPAIVTYRLHLLNLIPVLQMAVEAGSLGVSQGHYIGQLNPDNQRRVKRKLEAEPTMSIQSLASIVEQLLAEEHGVEMFADAPAKSERHQRMARDYGAALEQVVRLFARIAEMDDADLVVALEENLPGHASKAGEINREAERMARRINRLARMRQTKLGEGVAAA